MISNLIQIQEKNCLDVVWKHIFFIIAIFLALKISSRYFPQMAIFSYILNLPLKKKHLQIILYNLLAYVNRYEVVYHLDGIRATSCPCVETLQYIMLNKLFITTWVFYYCFKFKFHRQGLSNLSVTRVVTQLLGKNEGAIIYMYQNILRYITLIMLATHTRLLRCTCNQP